MRATLWAPCTAALLASMASSTPSLGQSPGEDPSVPGCPEPTAPPEPFGMPILEQGKVMLAAMGGALFIAGLAVGIGGAAEASLASMHVRRHQSRLTPGQCSDEDLQCFNLYNTLLKLDSAVNVSIGGFIVAGVAAAAVAVYIAWPSSEPSAKAPPVKVSPVVTGSAGGLVLYGQF